MGTGSFPGVRRPRHSVDHPPSCSAEAKERVELYIYSTSGHSWPVLQCPLPHPVQTHSWASDEKRRVVSPHTIPFFPPNLFSNIYGCTHNFSSGTSGRSWSYVLPKRLNYSCYKGHLGTCLRYYKINLINYFGGTAPPFLGLQGRCLFTNYIHIYIPPFFPFRLLFILPSSGWCKVNYWVQRLCQTERVP
jgi:hypothetical protein